MKAVINENQSCVGFTKEEVPEVMQRMTEFFKRCGFADLGKPNQTISNRKIMEKLKAA
jgi:hypothetical protein